MKLLITIVQDQDAKGLMNHLSKEGFAFTKISSTGGFLREGNTTLLIGVEELKVEQIFSTIEETCSARERRVEISVAPMGEAQFLPLTKVTVGGAMVFVLNVEKTSAF